jgi:FRG domain
MPWSEIHPKKLDNLYDVLNQISGTQAYVFRGHASVSWKNLVPSLHRILGTSAETADLVITEATAISAFRRHARSLVHFSELDYFKRILDSITLMQHYGAPTRLLDWTLSPWVACYFAAQGENQDDAVIWAFNRDALDWTNLRHRRSGSRDYAHFAALETAQNVEEWAYAAARAGRYVRTFRYEYANAQMGAQQSLFTISGQLGDNHDDALALSLSEPWQTLKIIVPKSEKATLRQRLFHMNVNALSLFPNVDGVGRHIREAIESSFKLDEGLVWRILERLKGRTRGKRIVAPQG